MEADEALYYHRDGVAMNGFDVVAYHKHHRGIKGQHKYACKWKHVIWIFACQEHLDLFSDNPEMYAPAYGGFCAFGVANGYKANPKPEAFSIVNERLYLNFADYVKTRWMEKQEDHVSSADKHWPHIQKTKPIQARRIPIWWKYQFLKLFGKDLFG